MPTNAEFANGTARYDPYRNFRFVMKWDGKPVAAFSKVEALAPGRSGQAGPAAITLESGLTCDAAFEQWASRIWDEHNPAADGSDGRRDLVLELYNEAGQVAIAYTIYRCWPSAFATLPVLDGAANELAIQTLTLQNEGWARDPSVIEPVEPAVTQPAD